LADAAKVPTPNIMCEDAERFIEEVRGDDPELAAKLRIEERELQAGRVSLALVRGSPDGTGCISRLCSMSALVVSDAVEDFFTSSSIVSPT
jgi:hypothetical protein